MARNLFKTLLVVTALVAMQAVTIVPVFAASVPAQSWSRSGTTAGELILMLGAVAAVLTAPVFLTVRQMCERLGVSRATFYRLVADGLIKKPVPVRPGSRNVRGLASDVDSYIAQQVAAARPHEDVPEAATS